MGLSRLGDYIELIDKRNSNLKYGIEDVRGISIKKCFIPTKADMDGVSLKPYLVVSQNDFCYVTVTSRNGEKITIALNASNESFICSSSYVAFKVKQEKTRELLPKYLFMYFNRPEFDRYTRFNSWGSARETFSWESLCEIDIVIPSIDIQQKFVNVYDALEANQKTYENGLEDLKLACDAFIEELRKNSPVLAIGPHIDYKTEKNNINQFSEIIGISNQGFIPPKVDGSENTSNYNILRHNYFIYNPSRINIGSIGLYKEHQVRICSPIYNVFHCMSENLLPEYLMMWFKRDEFKRYATFHSLASVRNNFTLDLMSEVKIPIPDIKVQQSISSVFNAYERRKEINERLKRRIADVCPILIKGSIEEAKRG
jgi:type I restriction enzyme S subunit